MAETFKFVSEKKIQGKTLSPEPSSCRNWGKSTNLHPSENSNLPEERGALREYSYKLSYLRPSLLVKPGQQARAKYKLSEKQESEEEELECHSCHLTLHTHK